MTIARAFPIMITNENADELNEKSNLDPNCEIAIMIKFDMIQAIIIFFSCEPRSIIKTIENASSSVEYINVQFAMLMPVLI